MAQWLPPTRTKVFLTRSTNKSPHRPSETINMKDPPRPVGATDVGTVAIHGQYMHSLLPPSVRIVNGTPVLFATVGVLSMLVTYLVYYYTILLPEDDEESGGYGDDSGSGVTATVAIRRRLDDGQETMLSYLFVRTYQKLSFAAPFDSA